MQRFEVTTKVKNFTLRPFRMSDAKSLAMHANDKQVTRNLSRLVYPYTVIEARKWIKKCQRDYRQKNPKHYAFAIVVNGEASGSINFSAIISGHEAEIIYWLGRKHWRKGLTTVIIGSAVKFAVKRFNLKRIYAYVFPANIASVRVLKKNKFAYEGIAKKGVKKGEKFIDAHVYGKVR